MDSTSTTPWADRLGIWTSALCIVHCIATPVLFAASAVFVHLIPGEEHVHRCLAFVVAALGAIALVQGYREHRRWGVLMLMSIGLLCIFSMAFRGERLHSHLLEILITGIGSLFMIAAHRLNHTCRAACCQANGTHHHAH